MQNKHYKEGWSLKTQDENEDLKSLASLPLAEDILQTLGDVKKEQDFQSDWLKKNSFIKDEFIKT